MNTWGNKRIDETAGQGVTETSIPGVRLADRLGASMYTFFEIYMADKVCICENLGSLSDVTAGN